MKVLIALVLVACACTGSDEAIPIDAPVVIDAAVIDAAVIDTATLDADVRCGACTSSQICVQYFNGTCGDGHVECQPRGAGCTGNTCSADCQFWHCGAADAGSVYTCFNGSCTFGEPQAPGALYCYGP